MYNCAVKIDEEVIMAFVNKARSMGISVIVSAGEADAQLVHLFRAGQIDYIVSEDMDFVVQGCNLVFDVKGWSLCPCTHAGSSACAVLFEPAEKQRLVSSAEADPCRPRCSFRGAPPHEVDRIPGHRQGRRFIYLASSHQARTIKRHHRH